MSRTSRDPLSLALPTGLRWTLALVAGLLLACTPAGLPTVAEPEPTSAEPAPVTPVVTEPAPAEPPAVEPPPAEPEPAVAAACGDQVCTDGKRCVEYYGIAGARGPKFQSCEWPCAKQQPCPSGTRCLTIADGPGQVCR